MIKKKFKDNLNDKRYFQWQTLSTTEDLFNDYLLAPSQKKATHVYEWVMSWTSCHELRSEATNTGDIYSDTLSTTEDLFKDNLNDKNLSLVEFVIQNIKTENLFSKKKI